MATTSKNWFITGISSGFGAALAKVLLQNGDKLTGTFRKPEDADAFTKQHQPDGFGIVCDVTKEEEVQVAVAYAIASLGYLDVVVNNAGYGSLGSIEETSEQEVLRQFDTNTFGPLRVLRAVLPHLRARKSGHILNMTSVGGLSTGAGAAIYHGSKFALEGIGESLLQQVGPLGIKVTNIEPSGFRTEWAGSSATVVGTQLNDYQSTVGQVVAAITGKSGQQAGDPDRAAQIMFDLVRQENPPLHLPLGKAAVKMAHDKFTELLKELASSVKIGESADFPA